VQVKRWRGIRHKDNNRNTGGDGKIYNWNKFRQAQETPLRSVLGLFDSSVVFIGTKIQLNDLLEAPLLYINVRETRRGNQEWKIQRHREHWVNKTQDEDK
jgi:hypothetical protein